MVHQWPHAHRQSDELASSAPTFPQVSTPCPGQSVHWFSSSTDRWLRCRWHGSRGRIAHWLFLDHLTQGFSHFCVCHDHSEGVLNHRFLGLSPRVSNSVSLGAGAKPEKLAYLISPRWYRWCWSRDLTLRTNDLIHYLGLQMRQWAWRVMSLKSVLGGNYPPPLHCSACAKSSLISNSCRESLTLVRF